MSYEKQSTYEDGSSKLQVVTMVFDERNGSRTFTITGKEGHLAKGATKMALDGAVKMVGSDGLTVRTEHATYSETDAVVRAPGPVDVVRGRTHATGIGMTWDKTADVLTILNQAVVHIDAETPADGPSDVTSGTATFARRDKYLRFERAVHMLRAGKVIEADTAIMYLSPDEKHVDTVELHDHARITAPKVSAGGLQAMSGGQMNLKYAADGETLQHALVAGDASIQIAGRGRQAGPPRSSATTIDIALAPGRNTPTALLGRENVQLDVSAGAGRARGARSARPTSTPRASRARG